MWNGYVYTSVSDRTALYGDLKHTTSATLGSECIMELTDAQYGWIYWIWTNFHGMTFLQFSWMSTFRNRAKSLMCVAAIRWEAIIRESDDLKPLHLATMWTCSKLTDRCLSENCTCAQQGGVHRLWKQRKCDTHEYSYVRTLIGRKHLLAVSNDPQ